MNDPTVLPMIHTIFWVFIGIIISLVLPLAVGALSKAGLEHAVEPTLGQKIARAWQHYGGNRYVKWAVAAVVVAMALVFLLGLEFYTVRDAALAGFAWESLVNKLLGQAGDEA